MGEASAGLREILQELERSDVIGVRRRVVAIADLLVGGLRA